MSTITTEIGIETFVNTDVPSLPGSALRVAALAQDINASARAVADAIGCDPIMAARILRAANSPLYAPERPVTSLQTAVGTLGNQAIHALVILNAASDTFNKTSPRSPAQRVLWEHSVAVGLTAREISVALGMRGGEESFICGLLHDIGKLILQRYDAKLYGQVEAIDDEQEMLTLEQELYGYTHSQIGALVAKRWNLPEDVCYAIYYHHQPSSAGQAMLMARTVDVADALVNRAGIGLRQTTTDTDDLLETESVIALRLSEEQLQEVWRKAEASMLEMVHLFG
ncbi:MAG: HDOD domain-containing protein [Pyrinomonadaceae bacterium]|nr:HDOD domain-containing protein [Pyrinomonadaceae bacterium]